jgi:hypothetical protein
MVKSTMTSPTLHGCSEEEASGEIVSINIRVPSEVRRQLKIYAAENNLTMCDLLMIALRKAGVLPPDGS